MEAPAAQRRAIDREGQPFALDLKSALTTSVAGGYTSRTPATGVARSEEVAEASAR
jgi:hypothetical protein